MFKIMNTTSGVRLQPQHIQLQAGRCGGVETDHVLDANSTTDLARHSIAWHEDASNQVDYQA